MLSLSSDKAVIKIACFVDGVDNFNHVFEYPGRNKTKREFTSISDSAPERISDTGTNSSLTYVQGDNWFELAAILKTDKQTQA